MDNVYFEDERPWEIAETEANYAAALKDVKNNDKNFKWQW